LCPAAYGRACDPDRTVTRAFAPRCDADRPFPSIAPRQPTEGTAARPIRHGRSPGARRAVAEGGAAPQTRRAGRCCEGGERLVEQRTADVVDRHEHHREVDSRSEGRELLVEGRRAAACARDSLRPSRYATPEGAGM